MTMNIQNLEPPAQDPTDVTNIFLRQDYAYPPPSAWTNGARFPSIPNARALTLVAAVVVTAVGTAPVATTSPRPPAGFALVLPSEATPSAVESRSEHYRRLRAAIVASGLPMLDDRELREEIESRTGDRLRTD